MSTQRSPRWAFMRTFDIPDPRNPHGTPYLRRLRIIQTPWFGLYLHQINTDDGDRDPHDHPWPFISVVLRGGYTERLHYMPHVDPGVFRLQTHARWSAHRMGTETAHLITRVAPGLLTLILVGRRRRTWGFWTPDGWVDWQEYDRMHPEAWVV